MNCNFSFVLAAILIFLARPTEERVIKNYNDHTSSTPFKKEKDLQELFKSFASQPQQHYFYPSHNMVSEHNSESSLSSPSADIWYSELSQILPDSQQYVSSSISVISNQKSESSTMQFSPVSTSSELPHMSLDVQYSSASPGVWYSDFQASSSKPPSSDRSSDFNFEDNTVSSIDNYFSSNNVPDVSELVSQDSLLYPIESSTRSDIL